MPAMLLVALWALAFLPSVARGARVVVLERNGSAVVRNEPSLRTPAATPTPDRAFTVRVASSARTATAGRTVRGELARLYRAHAISPTAYRRYATSVNTALTEVGRLSGTRAAELSAVLGNLHSMAVAGTLTPSRLPVLFLTLDRNRQWWRSGPLLRNWQRVQFAGSQLVWQYYAGQGIELQELGSFGKAQWYCAAGTRYGTKCRSMVSELLPLAAQRAGGLTWEYYFNFDGGVPPWTSAMSQGTALQTLADAYRTLGDRSYLQVARRALSVFSVPPPAGVAVPTMLGTRYLQYSFAPAPSQNVINGFLQSLIGLGDYAQVSGNPFAARLFRVGDAEARAEVPRFDTGAWSLYQPGEEDSLDYHTLVTGFLQQLCTMTHARDYCVTAARFERDLKTPPVLKLLTTRLRGATHSLVAFQVSKISRVGITVIRDARTRFVTSADFSYGRHTFAVPGLTQSGTYTVVLDATDLAGNYSRTSSRLQVS
jgi:D-glucuronyl C5-epimerase C-terminus